MAVSDFGSACHGAQVRCRADSAGSFASSHCAVRIRAPLSLSWCAMVPNACNDSLGRRRVQVKSSLRQNDAAVKHVYAKMVDPGKRPNKSNPPATTSPFTF